jgi:hypothetical protein
VDYQKLDAKLNEALAAPEGPATFDVFVEITPDAANDDLERLVRLGLPRPRGRESVVTARLSRTLVGEVSDVPAVRQVRLSRRLRHS